MTPLPCPFCGKSVDLDDSDTLYPSGDGWKFDEDLQTRTYHRYNEVPREQWCYAIHCPIQAGGCGAEMPGDSKEEVLAKWNKRTVMTFNAEALIAKLKQAASNLSHYNAAEGDSWYRERDARMVAQAEFSACKKECDAVGINVLEILHNGNYLV
jgi:hypothetical protein